MSTYCTKQIDNHTLGYVCEKNVLSMKKGKAYVLFVLVACLSLEKIREAYILDMAMGAKDGCNSINFFLTPI